jgi:hypothetical protein
MRVVQASERNTKSAMLFREIYQAAGNERSAIDAVQAAQDSIRSRKVDRDANDVRRRKRDDH